jgi:hypothetical protein
MVQLNREIPIKPKVIEMKVTEFTVKRSEWLRGEGPSPSFLLRNRDKKMCCLGFFCLAAGCSLNDLANTQVPSELEGECKANIAEQLLLQGLDLHLPVVNDLMTANDRSTEIHGLDIDIHSEEEREQVIAKLFAQMEVKVNFVD